MRVFFVIDIRNGKVVAAKRGEREKYVRIDLQSQIVSTSDPIEVVKSIEPRYLYAADLDRIEGRGENTNVLVKIASMVEELIADCGFRHPDELKDLPFKPVVGTETFDITKLDEPCYVSLDFREQFLDASGKFSDWRQAVEFLNTIDIDALIVLTIHAVGTMQPDLSLFEKVLEISDNPVMLGGGVSSVSDLEKLKEMGCSGVLVATAVHKRKIPLEIIRRGKF